MNANTRKMNLATRVGLFFATVVSVIAAMRENKLTALIPVTVLIIFAAVGLYFINLVSPLAPFVYSLF